MSNSPGMPSPVPGDQALLPVSVGKREPMRFGLHLLRLVLALALPLALLAGSLAVWSAEGERARALEAVEATAHVMQLAVDRELGMTVAVMETLATQPSVTAALLGGVGSDAAAAFRAEAAAVVTRRPAAMYNVTLIAPGEPPAQLVNTLVLPAQQPPTLGGVRYPPRPIGAPPQPGSAVREVLASSQMVISDLFRGSISGWTIVVAVPILQEGQAIGVISAGLRPAHLGEVLRKHLPAGGGVASLIDRGGVVVARTVAEEQFVGTPTTEAAIAFLREPGAEARLVRTPSLEGVPHYAALRRLEAAPLVLGYGPPQAVVDAPVRRTLAIAGGGGALVLALAGALALWLGRRLGQEIAVLGADAFSLAHGEAPPPRRPSSVSEVQAARSSLLHATAALAQGEERLRDLLATLDLGASIARDPDGTIRFWSKGCERLYGWTAEEAVGRVVHDLLRTVFPVPRTEIEASLAREGEWIGDLRHRSRDGREVLAAARMVLRQAAGGRAAAVLETFTDVTAQRRAEVALAQSEARFARAVDAARIGTWEWDALDDRLTGSPGREALYGRPQGALPDRAALLAAVHPDDRTAVAEAGARAMRGEADGHYEAEFRTVWPDGTTRWLRTQGRAEFGPDGVPLRMAGAVVDVTERREGEERQALLAREVDHRAKNALAVALSVVRLAPRDVPPAEFSKAVEGRVSAMARAHSLLSAERWTGADLRAIAEGEIAVHADRVQIKGVPVRVGPEATQPIAMVLHELATNAAKHGAFSMPMGFVQLSWERLPDAIGGGVQLRWQECGGPSLDRPPIRTGFGHRLVSLLSERQLGGTTVFDWSDPAGLRVAITIPARHLGEDRSAVGQAAPVVGPPVQPWAPPAVPPDAARGPRVLLVEDQALLALEAKAVLNALGCEVVGPARTLADALRLAATEPNLAAALLDVNLGGGEMVFPVMDVLRTRGVPYLLATGYGSAAIDAGQAHNAVAVLRKPYARELVAGALLRALLRRKD
ncbi:PAS domain-containing protein [Falsiroseomonas sp. E2-1-a4]|uniref:PAS domain-containing protein n=1 Tax=Falsiroseomonas sp. E2-1-a4 TaxID=3239299 RepID=UPI003F40A579